MLIGPGAVSLTFAYFSAPEHASTASPGTWRQALLMVSLMIAWFVTGDKGQPKGDLTKPPRSGCESKGGASRICAVRFEAVKSEAKSVVRLEAFMRVTGCFDS